VVPFVPVMTASKSAVSACGLPPRSRLKSGTIAWPVAAMRWIVPEKRPEDWSVPPMPLMVDRSAF
jgi:hypothetical protein